MDKVRRRTAHVGFDASFSGVVVVWESGAYNCPCECHRSFVSEKDLGMVHGHSCCVLSGCKDCHVVAVFCCLEPIKCGDSSYRFNIIRSYFVFVSINEEPKKIDCGATSVLGKAREIVGSRVESKRVAGELTI